jgi:hypothetical protein
MPRLEGVQEQQEKVATENKQLCRDEKGQRVRVKTHTGEGAEVSQNKG